MGHGGPAGDLRVRMMVPLAVHDAYRTVVRCGSIKNDRGEGGAHREAQSAEGWRGPALGEPRSRDF
eukprot:5710832-Prymnesium_polylepis.1